MSDELKPCPFCGHKPVMQDEFTVVCEECGAENCRINWQNRPYLSHILSRAETAEAMVSRLLGVVKPIVNYARVEIYECGGHGWMLEKPLKEFDKVVKEWERKDD